MNTLAITLWLLPPALLMLGLWLRQRSTGIAAVADAGWALSMAWMALLIGHYSDGSLIRRIMITLVSVAWAGRLAYHILHDRVRGKVEDRRYANLKSTWGDTAQRNLFFWFLGQVPFAALFSSAFFAAQHSVFVKLSVLDMAGLAIAIFSVLGESLADAQLKEFRAVDGNCSTACRRGLWKFSRHPNYFFEWTHWLAYPLLAWNGPYFALSLLAPIVMLGMLFKVSGIPLTEKAALASRGDDYREYQRTTSVFVPWFPKK